MAAPAIKLLMAAAGNSAAAGVTLPTAIAALSPVGYWKLDEASGTTATDSSGNGRNGTYTGSGFTLQGAAGGDGSSYADLGNAASSHILVADNNAWSIDTGPGLTVFMLVKPDNVNPGAQRHFVSKGAASNYEWGITYGVLPSGTPTSGAVSAAMWTAAGIGRTFSAMSGSPLTTSWQAVCFAFPGTSTTSWPLHYRNNNTDLTTSTGSSSSNAYVNGTAQLSLGWRNDSAANQYFQGGMAHVAIFGGWLNTTQIASLMTAADNDGWF